MKVCIHKPTNRLIETQFGEDAEVLLKNNLQYYTKEELAIVDMTQIEIEQKIKEQNKTDGAAEKQALLDSIKTMTLEQKVDFLLEQRGLKEVTK